MNNNKWRESYKKAKENGAERLNRFSTVSDVEVNPLYTPEDVMGFDYENELGYPGEYPFTRGVQATMYRGRLWTMRQFAGFGSAEDTNKRFHYLLEQGQTGLSVAFDFPTLYGYDSDDPKAFGEVGKCGVAISSLKDMEILFDKIPLDKVTTSMTINPPAGILLAMYIAVAEKHGVSRHKLGGTIQNDMLKEFIAQKTWITGPRPSLRIITDIMAFCTKEVPRWNTISISGYHIREAGSTAVQELAFTLANGIAYVQAGIDTGLDADDFAPRLSFFFNSHNDFFEEIAKFRAARKIWGRVMKERFKVKDKKSLLLRFHTQTAGCTLTAQQPLNNIVRVTLQALAAVLGGTQSLHTNSMDETLALPTEQAVTVALRTQQIIAEESGVANTIDPLAGSYFLEALTNKIETEAMTYIKKIDEIGGMIAAIEKGYPQKEIAEAAFKYQKQIEKGEKTVVGLNKYSFKEECPIDLLKIDDSVEKSQVARLQELRQTRDNLKVKEFLERISKACHNGSNMMPLFIEAVKSYATLGEICDVIRREFGEYRDPALF